MQQLNGMSAPQLEQIEWIPSQSMSCIEVWGNRSMCEALTLLYALWRDCIPYIAQYLNFCCCVFCDVKWLLEQVSQRALQLCIDESFHLRVLRSLCALLCIAFIARISRQ